MNPRQYRPGNSSDHEPNRGEDSLYQRGPEDPVDHRPHRSASDAKQMISLVAPYAIDGSAQTLRGGFSIAIKEESQKQAQDYLKNSLAQRTAAAENEPLRRGEQPGDFCETSGATLMHRDPVCGAMSSDQRKVR